MNDDFLRETLAELYEQAPCGYIFTDPAGLLLRVNGTFLHWTGYSREDLVGVRRFQDLLPAPGRLFFETKYDPLLRMQGFVNEVTFDLIRKDRSRLPVLVNSVQRVDADGRPTTIASTVFDATHRRRYERELLQARQRVEQLAAIVTNAGDAIISARPDWTIESWNGAAVSLFGLSEAEGIGRDVRDLLTLTDDRIDEAGLLDQLNRGDVARIDTRASRQDGRHVDVSVTLTPHQGLLGELSAVSLILRDISERRAVERMKDELVAIVSHDLRSPLSFIVGVSDLLLTRRLEETEQRHLLETMSGEGQRLSALVDDFLDIQRMEFGAMRVEPAPVDLRVVLDRALAVVGDDPARPIVVDVGEAPPLLFDQQHLQQVLVNLLSNARKYSPAGGEIRIAARPLAGEVEIAIADSGLGIPPDALPRLFQKFYRVQTADRRSISGTGLGLAICRRIVEAYGGQIQATSDGPGLGSTFAFTVPAATTSDGRGDA